MNKIFQKIPLAKIFLMSKSLNRSSFGIFKASIISFGIACLSFGQTKTIAAESFIVEMDLVPHTVGKGLGIYGLMYAFLEVRVPEARTINAGKPKHGVDFHKDPIQFRSGPFIVDAKYRTQSIMNDDRMISLFDGNSVFNYQKIFSSNQYLLTDLVLDYCFKMNINIFNPSGSMKISNQVGPFTSLNYG